mmetsp:Transcript_16784/g.19026  ORF Transcript_16784/g.19026 Transcript_16784/m.19026 type:complete len:228 (-) Transcript_16784:84-767(-)|eukprot:CAMPEP_0184069032 /NCGR_PEP_ID=MMETSP0957-20130417/38916_1 /TAXON_ID=627963 /ORGANISM="Aplanochytrium sp, Strain PBS07" /LENGTH=227 /DNA_ID=CAMNT_0026368255 /DNA_START=60 /DNA_END=743 /DNA_ORIENTATION=+
MVLKLYGVEASQPVRTVKWLLEMKNEPFEFVQIMPGSPKQGGSKSAEYLEKAPTGLVPLIEEDDGFLLWESHAILAYLCNKNGWDDMYPKDAKRRGIVDQWLHWHHQNTRKFTIALFAPLFRPDIKIPPEQQKSDRKVLKMVSKVLEDQLSRNKFIAGDTVTIADLAVYGELGQFQEHYCGGYDFAPYPHLVAWMKSMTALEKYKEVHGILKVIGKAFKKRAQKAKL